MSDDADPAAAIWSAISRLDSHSRQLFLMVKFERYPLKSAAAALGWPLPEAKRLLAQAKKIVDIQIRRSQKPPAVAAKQPGARQR